LEILGLGKAKLKVDSPGFLGKVVIRGARLILDANGRLANAGSFLIANGSTLSLDNSSSAHADRIGSTATITLNAGTLAFNPGDFGFLTQELGILYLQGGASQIDLHLGSAAGGWLLAESLQSLDFQASTLNLRYISPSGGLAPINVHFAVKDKDGLALFTIKEIIPWITITQGDGSVVDWATLSDVGGSAILNPFQNYETGGAANWDETSNVLIDGSTVSYTGAVDHINSLKLANGAVLRLTNDNELALDTGLLSTGLTENHVTGSGTLTGGYGSYFHVHSPSLSIEGGARLGAGSLVKTGQGTLRLASEPTVPHFVDGITINEGRIWLEKGTLDDPEFIVIGDGTGTDILELPANRVNPIDFSDPEGDSFIRLRGSPYGDPDSGELNAAILRFGGSTVQNAPTLEVEGRGTLDFVGGTIAAPNMLILEELLIDDSDTTTLFIRNWEDQHDLLLVRYSQENIDRIDADFLAHINFEGYDAPATWVYWSNDYWEIRPAPEPTTYGAILGAIGLGLFFWQKRKRSL